MSPNDVGARVIGSAAQHVITAVPADQRAALCLPFNDPQRCEWHYTPGRRPGVSLGEMDRDAAKAVHELLTTVLSRAAHTRVTAITGLEDVLDQSEGGRSRGPGDAPRLEGRHAGDYWTVVFGHPGDPVWGWRFEGHHVSINITVAGGAVSTTPFFLGANPATITDEGGRSVSRPLGPEEDVAIRLLALLDDDQRKRAVVSDAAPHDILSDEAPDATSVVGLGALTGLPVAALRPDQVSLLRDLAALYVNRLAAGLAEPVLARLDRELSAFSFVWAGSTPPSPGQPHYYRLEGPRFLAEFDNRQNSANHIHSVWREPGGDFGARLLPEGLGHLS